MRRITLASLVALGAVLAFATTTAAAAGCPACGKNLIKNPSAEAGIGLTAVDARGVVPGWTNVAGQFGAASYTFANGWFSATSKGSPTRGKNYFFGGTTREAVTAEKGSIGKQTIALPASAVGRKATLSGWIGNYGKNTTQVRAEFADASGKVLSMIRIGPDTTVANTDMAARSRSGTVPAGTKQATIVVCSPAAAPTTSSQERTSSPSC